MCAQNGCKSKHLAFNGQQTNKQSGRILDSSLLSLSVLPESLPLIIILSAVIGGVILTMFAIIVMVMCRRMSAFQPSDSKGGGFEKGYASSTLTGTSSSSSKPSSSSTNGGVSSSSALLNTTATSDVSSSLAPPHHKANGNNGSGNGGLSVGFSDAVADWEQDSLEGSANHPAAAAAAGVHQPRIVNGLGDYTMVRTWGGMRTLLIKLLYVVRDEGN